MQQATDSYRSIWTAVEADEEEMEVGTTSLSRISLSHHSKRQPWDFSPKMKTSALEFNDTKKVRTYNRHDELVY